MTAEAPEAFDLASALQKYKLEDVDLKYPRQALIYSQPGSGKTHTALTASELPFVKKMLYLDCEGSTVGVASQFDLSKIDIIPVHEQPNPVAFLNTIIKHLESGAEGYDCVAIDPLDSAQDTYIKQLKPHSTDSWAMWSEVADWTNHIADVLRKSVEFSIIVVHDKTDTDPSGKPSTLLRLSGSAKETLPGKADLVAYLERRLDKDDNSVHTFAHLEVSDRKVTKNRFHFPPYVKDVSFPGLFRYIDKNREES